MLSNTPLVVLPSNLIVEEILLLPITIRSKLFFSAIRTISSTGFPTSIRYVIWSIFPWSLHIFTFSSIIFLTPASTIFWSSSLASSRWFVRTNQREKSAWRDVFCMFEYMKKLDSGTCHSGNISHVRQYSV